MSKNLAILLELGKALDIPADKIETLVKDKKEEEIDQEAVSTLFKDAHRAKIDVISRNLTFQNGKDKDEAYKSAERKIKTDLEAKIKEKFGLTSDIEGLDNLLDEAATVSKTSTGKKVTDMTDDEIKKHPLFISREKELQKQIKDATKEGEAAITNLKAEYAQEKVMGIVSKKALEEFDKLNPILSEDKVKAQSQRELVLKLIADNKFQSVEGEEHPIVLNPDGTVLEDEFKNKVKFADFVKEKTSQYFDFKVAEERDAPNGSAGNGGGNGGANAAMTYAGKLPTNRQELATLLTDKSIPVEQRKEVSEWAETNLKADAAQQ